MASGVQTSTLYLMMASIVFFRADGCAGGMWGLRPQLEHVLADALKFLASQCLPHLWKPLGLFLFDVVLHVFYEDRGLRVESFVGRSHRDEFHHEQISHVMLLVGLQDVVLDVRDSLADCRIHTLVLDVGVHGQRFDDLGDDVCLRLRRVWTGFAEGVEQLLD
ncbi:UNVERIFIED_CONTAM: hypothetical protein DES50_1011028 [Williamsia faeni]